MSLAYDFPVDEPADGEAAPENALEQPQERGMDKLARWAGGGNIADELEQTLLDAIGMKVVREYDIDDGTRSDWIEQTTKAMELAMQVAKQKDYPWPKAANVIFPLMTTAAMQFASRAYPAIVMGRNVVKGVVIGDDSGQFQADPQGNPVMDQAGQPIMLVPPGIKQKRADRIGAHMSWQLLEEQPEWEPETDQLLHILPIVGCVFRKTYFEAAKGRNCSHMVPAQNLVISYFAKSLELAPRITEKIKFYPLEIKEKELAGVFREIEYTVSPDAQGDEDAPHEFLEQHRYLDLDEDGYPEPYCVTVHKQSSKVVRLVARYDAESVQVRDGKVIKIDPIHYYTKYDFIPNPDGGIYGIGFGQVLKPINEAVNSTLNQLLDAGHLANTSGGFIGKGLSMHSGSVRFAMGEYKTVNATGSQVRDAIVPVTFPGPSAVLFNLLRLLIDAGKEVASIKDVLSGELTSQTMQPTTALAMIEQGLKVFSAIYKRIHRSLKAELEKLYRLNRVYMNPQAQYRIGDEWKTIQREDYEQGSGVEPISDPGMVSDQQRMAKAQFLMQFLPDPICNPIEVRKRIFTAANLDEPDKLINTQPPPPDPKVQSEMIKAQTEQAKAAATIEKMQLDMQAAQQKHIMELERMAAEVAKIDAEMAAMREKLGMEAAQAQLDAVLKARQADKQIEVTDAKMRQQKKQKAEA